MHLFKEILVRIIKSTSGFIRGTPWISQMKLCITRISQQSLVVFFSYWVQVLPVRTTSISSSIIFFPFGFKCHDFPFSVYTFYIATTSLISSCIQTHSSNQSLHIGFRKIIFIGSSNAGNRTNGVHQRFHFLQIFNAYIINRITGNQTFRHNTINANVRNISKIFTQFTISRSTHSYRLTIHLPHLWLSTIDDRFKIFRIFHGCYHRIGFAYNRIQASINIILLQIRSQSITTCICTVLIKTFRIMAPQLIRERLRVPFYIRPGNISSIKQSIAKNLILRTISPLFISTV